MGLASAAFAFIRRVFGPRHMFAAGPFVQVAPTAPDGTIDFSAPRAVQFSNVFTITPPEGSEPPKGAA